ncbi:MAG TPA: type VII secretion system-associated protein [Actinocatenispora sp.]
MEPQTIEPEIRRLAAEAPGEPIALVDPYWEGDGEAPGWAVIGTWRTGDDGGVTGFVPNEDYRPSPERRGWPEPTDEVDTAIQLAAAGYRTESDVLAALARAEVAVLVSADGLPASLTAPDGSPAVAVFTAPAQLGELTRFGVAALPVADLLPLVPDGHVLYVNATAVVSTTATTEALDAALAASH